MMWEMEIQAVAGRPEQALE